MRKRKRIKRTKRIRRADRHKHPIMRKTKARNNIGKNNT